MPLVVFKVFKILAQRNERKLLLLVFVFIFILFFSIERS